MGPLGLGTEVCLAAVPSPPWPSDLSALCLLHSPVQCLTSSNSHLNKDFKMTVEMGGITDTLGPTVYPAGSQASADPSAPFRGTSVLIVQTHKVMLGKLRNATRGLLSLC